MEGAQSEPSSNPSFQRIAFGARCTQSLGVFKGGQMNTTWLHVDDLNDDGATYLLEQLYGIAENGISSWQVMGAIMERSKVGITYSAFSNTWDAEIVIGNEAEYASASNPRLAIARVLIRKAILENPTNSYNLKLPLRVAFEIGLSRDSQSFAMLLALSGGVLDNEEKILLEIRA